jgi:hypothetical protein
MWHLLSAARALYRVYPWLAFSHFVDPLAKEIDELGEGVRLGGVHLLSHKADGHDDQAKLAHIG